MKLRPSAPDFDPEQMADQAVGHSRGAYAPTARGRASDGSHLPCPPPWLEELNLTPWGERLAAGVERLRGRRARP